MAAAVSPSDAGPFLSGEDWQNESFDTHMVNLFAELLRKGRANPQQMKLLGVGGGGP